MTKISEFHGFKPLSEQSIAAAASRHCPFISEACKKRRSGGACSLRSGDEPAVIICPNRLYGDNFGSIRRIAREAFGNDCELITNTLARRRHNNGELTGREVIVFGQGWSGEIGISAPGPNGDGGTFKVDFLLVHVNQRLDIRSFVAVEVQTIDTTNSYKNAADHYYRGETYPGYSESADPGETRAGFNWENVTKRILPQLIYKGHALRREALAKHGLFFVVPHPVLEKIRTRVGNELLEYPRGMGTITFHPYSLIENDDSAQLDLSLEEPFTTSVEQLAFAFVSPRNLPELGVYAERISRKIQPLA